jgi:hypothetical protein
MRAASDTESSGPTETTGDVITSLTFMTVTPLLSEDNVSPRFARCR